MLVSLEARLVREEPGLDVYRLAHIDSVCLHVLDLVDSTGFCHYVLSRTIPVITGVSNGSPADRVTVKLAPAGVAVRAARSLGSLPLMV